MIAGPTGVTQFRKSHAGAELSGFGRFTCLRGFPEHCGGQARVVLSSSQAKRSLEGGSMYLNYERVLRFLAVARELSVTRAATILGVDQPWLSRQIKQLEEQLGMTLFDRRGGRMALTAEGIEFRSTAEKLAEAAEATCAKAEEMRRRRDFVLRVGASYFTYWFEQRFELLNQYKILRPKVEMEMTYSELSNGIVDMLHEHTIDIGFLIGPLDQSNLECILIDKYEANLFIPREDPLANAAAIALNDLQGRRVAVSPGDRNPERFRNAYGWVHDVGAVPVEVSGGRRFAMDEAQKQRLIVLNLVAGERPPSDFVRRPIIGPRPSIELFVARRKGAASPAVDRFWRLCEEATIALAA